MPEVKLAEQLPLSLGKRERECIALAKLRSAALLTNDQRAGNYCRNQNIRYLHLPAILRLARLNKVASQVEIQNLMQQISQSEGIVFKNAEQIFAI